MKTLSVRNLTFGYNCWNVLDDISFDATKGNLICLLGKNGSGKSTLFRCILGLLPFKQGEILLDGISTSTLSPKKVAQKVAYIPQYHNGVFSFSVMDIVLMGTAPHMKRFSFPGKEQQAQAIWALSMMGIEEFAHRNFSHLSGGEQQLVLIARAIAQQAKILLMDEPCSSLDYGNQIKVMQQVSYLASQGYLILLSTHNPEHALLFGDKALVLSEHHIAAYGNAEETLTEDILQQIYDTEIDIKNIGGTPICVPRVAEKKVHYVGVI